MSETTVVQRELVETPAAEVMLTINGCAWRLALDTRTSLLDALREHLHLTGGRRITSCLSHA